MYEGEVIYDIVRRKAYILNFGKQFSVWKVKLNDPNVWALYLIIFICENRSV